MIESSLWPVQAALVTRWEGDAAVAGLVADRIYDGQAPQGAARPYVVLRGKTETPANVLARGGWQDTITAAVISSYPGDKEALAIVQAMDAALREPLSVDGFGQVRARREMLETLVEDDGTRNVPVRYRFITARTPS